MLGFLFGWRKASKCKKVIKKAQCRLKLLKSKRHAIVRQSCEDVAELIKNGHEQTALNRIEQLIRDESLAAAYELLDQFCEFILVHLSYIRKHKNCPNDINEAVSSLIFASARCGDLPELRAVRKLFGERYGERFATTAVELSPGNLVNHQLKEKLSVKSVTDDQKYRVVDEIARDYSIQREILALEYYPDWQLVQEKEKTGHQVVNKDPQINEIVAVSHMSPSEVEEIENDVINVDSSTNNSLSKSSGSAISSTIQQCSPFFLVSPLQKKEDKVENCAELNPFTVSGLEDKGEKLALSLSVESLPSFSEERVVYLDDIEEYQFSVSKDGPCLDRRLFKFTSSGLSRREKNELDWDQCGLNEEESPSEKSTTRNSRKSRREPEKISRGRSTPLQNHGIMDTGCMVYYHKPCRRYQKPFAQGIPQSSYALKRLKQHSSSEMERNIWLSCNRLAVNSKICDSSSDYPCYFCVCDNIDSVEELSSMPKSATRTVLGFCTHIQQETLSGECCHCQSLGNEELKEGKEHFTFPQKPNRRNHNGAALYNGFTYPACQMDEKERETNAEISESLGSFADSNVSFTRTISSLKRIGTAAPDSRAITLAPERPKENEDKMLRSTSFPSPLPKHVHPKLPDYDDIAARFTALKRESLENKHIPEEKQFK